MTNATALYLAGPMSGYPDLNRAAFAASAERLRGRGLFVLNPGALNPDCNYREALVVDLTWICAHAEIIAFQEGWEASPGALAEHALAEALMRDKAKPIRIWYLPAGFSKGAGGTVKVRGWHEGRVREWAFYATAVYEPRGDEGLDGIGTRVPPAEWG